MKVLTAFAMFLICVGLVVVYGPVTSKSEGPIASAQDNVKPKDVYTLSVESKLGVVTFNHADHVSKNRSADGKSPLACIECHHVSQPASEAAKCPPLKTAWPADRTTTLTADLLEKDSKSAAVAVCRDCHARTGEKPKLLAEIPQLTFEGSATATVLTNQNAFHRSCAGCHDEAVKIRTELNIPTSKKCLVCHKKAAA